MLMRGRVRLGGFDHVSCKSVKVLKCWILMTRVRVSPKDCKKDGGLPTNPPNATSPPNEPFERREKVQIREQ